MKGLNQMLKQLQEAQSRMQQVQEELAGKEVEASAGGGMVRVRMNGRHELVSLKIDPQVVDPEDVEMLEDLVIAALGEARGRVEEMVREEMGRVAGGLTLPGMF
ncbi:MAG: YbaB/EbfC family nucleoid-associated protein [Candidatus Eisenbacteria bacterium]|nr:YbaB/EbfC family nucleoid-associated protein [Candidatus Eisenbacteria bacterium]